MRIIRVDDQPDVPWKNGGGMTRELLSAATVPAGFDWRVSVATIEKDGPFSNFPGIDRTLVGLAGHGSLRISDRSAEVMPGSVLRFNGDEPVVATVVEGPIRVLNIMSAASRWHQRVGAAQNIGAACWLDDQPRMFAVVQTDESSSLRPGDLLLDTDQLTGLESVIAMEITLLKR